VVEKAGASAAAATFPQGPLSIGNGGPGGGSCRGYRETGGGCRYTRVEAKFVAGQESENLLTTNGETIRYGQRKGLQTH